MLPIRRKNVEPLAAHLESEQADVPEEIEFATKPAIAIVQSREAR
ncbi:hypothetical protein [Burkholderia cepacia]